MPPTEETDIVIRIFLEIICFFLLLSLAKIVIKELYHDIEFAYSWLRNGVTEHGASKPHTASAALNHFRTAFLNPERLIKGMAKNNFVLSGSRALDYFVPGSASLDSDWDFYIPHNMPCIRGAMDALEECGVIWDDFFTPLRKLFMPPYEEKSIDLTLNKADALVKSWNRPSSRARASARDADLKQVMQDLTVAVGTLNSQPAIRRTERIIKVKNATIRILPDANQSKPRNLPSDSIDADHHSYGPNLDVRRGTVITPDGTTHTVQLISYSGKSPLDLIFAFYASHVQCFISAFGAVHLYFPTDKKATSWPLNTQHRPSAEAALEKYAARGYKFSTMSAGGHRQLRQLSDHLSTAKFVEFDFPFSFPDVPETLQSLRRQALKKIMWIETGERTYKVADAEVEEAMGTWVHARSVEALTEVLKGDGKGDGEAEEAAERLSKGAERVRSGLDVKRMEDTILGV